MVVLCVVMASVFKWSSPGSEEPAPDFREEFLECQFQSFIDRVGAHNPAIIASQRDATQA
jgi:hypothetical protein